MKNSGSCSKCGGAAIVRVPDLIVPASSGLPTGFLDSRLVLATRFACADCGFSEEWIEDEESLKTLRAQYEIAQLEEEDEDEDNHATGALPLLICDVCGSALVVEDDSFACPRCS